MVESEIWLQSLPQSDLNWKTFSKETIVVHIAKKEYHKYNIITYILQPKLDSTMLYLKHFPQKVLTIGLIS